MSFVNAWLLRPFRLVAISGPDFVDQPGHADAFWKTPSTAAQAQFRVHAPQLFDNLVGPHTRTIRLFVTHKP